MNDVELPSKYLERVIREGIEAAKELGTPATAKSGPGPGLILGVIIATATLLGLLRLLTD